MSAHGLRGGRIGRCLALAAAAPMVFGDLALAQQPQQGRPAAAPPVLSIPPAPQVLPLLPPPPPVEIPALSPAQAQVALKVLRAADLHGLQPKDYAVDGAPETGVLSPAQQTALGDALVRYARDVRIGRMDPEEFPELWQMRPAAWDPSRDLVAALAENRLQAWLDGLAPRYSGYHALRRNLVRYREIAAKGGW
jgi:L,D-transpeptidase YcbB